MRNSNSNAHLAAHWITFGRADVLGRAMEPAQGPPKLYHSLHHQKKSSMLSVAADANYIYSGSQGDDISVSLLVFAMDSKAYASVVVYHRFGIRIPLH